MMDDCFSSGGDGSSRPALDHDALARVLGLGDAALRDALCSQLAADFRRLRTALDAEEAHLVARTAHEIKGLAATIGANPLADIAASVDKVVASVAPEARLALVRPLKAEIDAVLSALALEHSGSARQ
ncbi:MAG: hypothetical protein Kow0013_21610 [Pararhodobacter sp.]